MERRNRTQSGNILLVLLLLAVAGMGFAIYKNEADKSAKRTAAQQAAIEERRAKEAEQQANAKRAQEERDALQRQADAAKSNDLLAEALRAADDLVSRWDDALRIAHNTSRMSLATPVAGLQAIKRDAQSLTVPPCLSAGKGELVEGMTLTIDGFLEFMANTAKMGNVLANAKFEDAKPHFDRYRADRSMCPHPVVQK